MNPLRLLGVEDGPWGVMGSSPASKTTSNMGTLVVPLDWRPRQKRSHFMSSTSDPEPSCFNDMTEFPHLLMTFTSSCATLPCLQSQFQANIMKSLILKALEFNCPCTSRYQIHCTGTGRAQVERYRCAHHGHSPSEGPAWKTFRFVERRTENHALRSVWHQ